MHEELIALGHDGNDLDPFVRGKLHELVVNAGKHICDFKLGHHPKWTGTYEPEVVNAIGHFVRPGDCVIDVGASIGFFTVLLSKIVGEDGIVLAYEPEQRSYNLLRQNINVNKLNNVAAFRQALFSNDCMVDLWVTDPCGYSSMHRYVNASHCEKVYARALDKVIINEQDQPRFLKVDVEGVEEDVLRGAERLLRKGIDCVIAEFNYSILSLTNRTDLSLRKFMHDLGYDMFFISAIDKERNYLPPMPIDPTLPFELQNGFSVNVMFSTKEKVEEYWR